MARMLEFRFEGQSFKCAIDKVDRSSLYGSIDVETRDPEGLRCEIATLASDGRTLIPTGGTAFGYLAKDGRWLERGELTPVDKEGRKLNPVGSSFDTGLDLEARVSPERFLDHSIRLSYVLDVVDGNVPPGLEKELDGGAVFKTDFSYRGGINPDPAFMLKGTDGALWLLVGEDGNVSFLSFAEVATQNPDEAEAEKSDELDFDMM